VLEEPFFVLATQNPIEQEGTYPLPEAQLDRFMFNLWLEYPSPVEEVQIVKATTSLFEPQLRRVLTGEQISSYQDLVRRVPVADNVIEFAVRLATRTRPKGPDAPQFARHSALSSGRRPAPSSPDAIRQTSMTFGRWQSPRFAIGSSPISTQKQTG
jgi:MoxR-like ATPase